MKLSNIGMMLAAALALGASKPSPQPIACRLDAFDGAQRTRHAELVTWLQGVAKVKRELPDGYEFALPADDAALARASEWMRLERRCCPFLVFGLELDGDRAVHLRLTGPSGAKELIAAAFIPPPASTSRAH